MRRARERDNESNSSVYLLVLLENHKQTFHSNCTLSSFDSFHGDNGLQASEAIRV